MGLLTDRRNSPLLGVTRKQVGPLARSRYVYGRKDDHVPVTTLVSVALLPTSDERQILLPLQVSVVVNDLRPQSFDEVRDVRILEQNLMFTASGGR